MIHIHPMATPPGSEEGRHAPDNRPRELLRTVNG